MAAAWCSPVRAALDRRAKGSKLKLGFTFQRVGGFGRRAERQAAVRLRLRNGPLSFIRCLGDGKPRGGGSCWECIPTPPCTPACGTALKSCGVCHRSASPRMRKGKVSFFFSHPPPPPPPTRPFSFQPPLVLQLNFFFFSENTRGKRSPERGRERRRQLARRAGGWGGGRGPCGRSVCLRGAGSRGSLLQAPRRRLRHPESGSVQPLPSELLRRCRNPTARRPLPALPPLRPRRQTRRWAATPAMDRRS